MNRVAAISLIIFALSFSASSFAQTRIKPEERREIEEYFQSSIGGNLATAQLDISASEIKGFVEIYSEGALMYFNSESQLLFIGEIYTKTGESLTKASLKQRQLNKLAKLPAPALILNGGKGYKKIIEFTDPDCPYCRKANDYLKQHPIQMERHIYFDARLHPSANQKIIHILCAPDPATEFQRVYSESVAEFQYCDAGANIATHLQKTSIEMAVAGTPTFFIGENLVRGFDKQKLEDYLTQNNGRSL